jgi:hypothetical protein
MNQSVLDELEFLDLGGMDNGKGEEAEFDFVYHLPHADFERVVLHNSISDFGKIDGFKKSDNQGSVMNLHRDTSHVDMNRKKLSRALDPMFNGKKETIRKKFKKTLDQSASRIGGSRLLGTNSNTSANPSNMNLRKSRNVPMGYNRRKSLAPSNMDKSMAPSSNGGSRDMLNSNAGSKNMLGSKGSRNMLGSRNELADSDDGGIKITVNGEDLGAPLIQIDDGSEGPSIQVTGLNDGEDRGSRDMLSNGSRDMLSNGSGMNELANKRAYMGSRDVSDPFRSTNSMAKSYYEGSEVSGSEYDGAGGQGPDIYEDAMAQIHQEEEIHRSKFHALPLSVRQRVAPKTLAQIMISVVSVIAFYVYFINIEKVVLGN